MNLAETNSLLSAITFQSSLTRRQIAKNLKTGFTPALALAILSGLEELNFLQNEAFGGKRFSVTLANICEASGCPLKTVKTVLNHFQRVGILFQESKTLVANEPDFLTFRLTCPTQKRILSQVEQEFINKIAAFEYKNMFLKIHEAIANDDGGALSNFEALQNDLFDQVCGREDLVETVQNLISLHIDELQHIANLPQDSTMNAP